jgi:hypothetical protein
MKRSTYLAARPVLEQAMLAPLTRVEAPALGHIGLLGDQLATRKQIRQEWRVHHVRGSNDNEKILRQPSCFCVREELVILLPRFGDFGL